MAIKTERGTKASAFSDQNKGPAIGTIVVTKVAYEHVPVHSGFGEESQTIGSLIDEQLAQYAHDFVEVQKVEFHVHEDMWADLSKHIRATQRNPRTGMWDPTAVAID